MNTSYKWLQSYFEKPLPEVKKLAEILTMGAFEVEGVEKKGKDFMIDVDILPNRASDCLSHRGIAREISILAGLSMKAVDSVVLETPHPNGISIEVVESRLCRRYLGKVIGGVKIASSPDWLKECLESIGQKSINNIVDATNFVMFDIGQPLHAFDLDKISGEKIIVRMARNGEKITTLDDKEVVLTEKDLVIADQEDVLAIAGVKGGKKAQVDENTTRIVLEAANFDPASVRKTSRRLGILTDSSKRFENDITPVLAGEAIEKLALLIREFSGNEHVKIGESVEFYQRIPGEYKLGVSVVEVNKLLGTNFSDKEVEDILKRFDFKYEKIDNPIQKILELAPKFLGVPYKYGASITYDAPRYFDCSSFIGFIFAQAGIAIPRMAVDQYVFGEDVPKKDLQPGDLVFSNTKEGKIYYESVEFLKGTKIEEGVDHCGVYLGKGKVIHSSRYNRDGIEIQDLSNSEQFKEVVAYKRINTSDSRYVVSVPPERLDLRIKEDLVEEIARVYGYVNIKGVPLDIKTDRAVNKRLYYMNRIRDILQSAGYSENYGYTFRGDGDVEILKPLSEGKDFLRTNLSDGMTETLLFNDRYKDLLAIDRVRMFEFGSVFNKDSEWMSFAIGVGVSKQKAEDNVCGLINKEFSTNLSCDIFGKQGGVFETDFDKLVDNLREEVIPQGSQEGVEGHGFEEQIMFKKISQYPFIARDIAVWTTSGTQADEVLDLVKSEAGDLLVQNHLFDVYEKDEKISYAFNLVFQSQEKTLTDEEITPIMEKITKKIENKGWEVR